MTLIHNLSPAMLTILLTEYIAININKIGCSPEMEYNVDSELMKIMHTSYTCTSFDVYTVDLLSLIYKSLYKEIL